MLCKNIQKAVATQKTMIVLKKLSIKLVLHFSSCLKISTILIKCIKKVHTVALMIEDSESVAMKTTTAMNRTVIVQVAIDTS